MGHVSIDMQHQHASEAKSIQFNRFKEYPQIADNVEGNIICAYDGIYSHEGGEEDIDS